MMSVSKVGQNCLSQTPQLHKCPKTNKVKATKSVHITGGLKESNCFRQCTKGKNTNIDIARGGAYYIRVETVLLFSSNSF